MGDHQRILAYHCFVFFSCVFDKSAATHIHIQKGLLCVMSSKLERESCFSEIERNCMQKEKNRICDELDKVVKHKERVKGCAMLDDWVMQQVLE